MQLVIFNCQYIYQFLQGCHFFVVSVRQFTVTIDTWYLPCCNRTVFNDLAILVVVLMVNAM